MLGLAQPLADSRDQVAPLSRALCGKVGLRRNAKILVAREWAAWSRDHNRARGRSTRNDRRHVCVADHDKLLGRDTVEGHGGCPGQALPKDLSCLTNLPRWDHECDGRWEAQVEAVDRARVIGIEEVCSVEQPIGALQNRCRRG